MAKRPQKDFKERVRRVVKQATEEQPSARTRKQARTGALPGMEDHAIKPFDHAAAEYADIRDQRMELTTQEVDLKSRTMKLMKKYGKTKYQHNGILIEIEPGAETIKVRVKKAEEPLDDSDGDAPDAAPDDEGAASVEFSE